MNALGVAQKSGRERRKKKLQAKFWSVRPNLMDRMDDVQCGEDFLAIFYLIF
jgi:hypothetical protein